MNSAFRPLAAFLALSLATAAPALAATDFRPADAKPITTTDIQLVQQAALVVPRDRITATLRVILRGPDARQIQVEINRRMVAALARVKDAPAVIAETGSYSVNHPYTPQGESSTWQGEQTITLTSGEIDAVRGIWQATLQNDGLVMGEMRFFVSPESLKAVQDELTATALKAMQDRATNIAGDLSLKVSRYKTVTSRQCPGADRRNSDHPIKGAAEGQEPQSTAAGRYRRRGTGDPDRQLHRA